MIILALRGIEEKAEKTLKLSERTNVPLYLTGDLFCSQELESAGSTIHRRRYKFSKQ